MLFWVSNYLYMRMFCIFVFALVQCNWACFTWKCTLEIYSLLLWLPAKVKVTDSSIKKIVEVNDVYRHDSYKQIWPQSFRAMSNINSFCHARQPAGWKDRQRRLITQIHISLTSATLVDKSTHDIQRWRVFFSVHNEQIDKCTKHRSTYPSWIKSQQWSIPLP